MIHNDFLPSEPHNQSLCGSNDKRNGQEKERAAGLNFALRALHIINYTTITGANYYSPIQSPTPRSSSISR